MKINSFKPKYLHKTVLNLKQKSLQYKKETTFWYKLKKFLHKLVGSRGELKIKNSG